jgi:hypothetical protein
MVPLTHLILPIILAAVIVFVASSLLHMVLRYHRSDYRQLPNEETARAALRGLAPGLYMMPWAMDPKECNSPAMKQKFVEGPVGQVIVMPSRPMSMGPYLGKWFAYCLLVSIFTAYLAGRTLAPGTQYLQVFRVAGTAAFMAYGIGVLPNGIWGGHPKSNVAKSFFDGLIFGLLTGGTFGWLWPHA